MFNYTVLTVIKGYMYNVQVIECCEAPRDALAILSRTRVHVLT